MKPRTALAVLLGLFVLAAVATIAAREIRRSGATPPGMEPSPATAGAVHEEGGARPNRIVVTYFVTNVRCAACHQIETLSEAAVHDAFAAELAAGEVEWRIVNTDEPQHAHYIEHYQLHAKSVIVSAIREGREQRWKNLEQIWKLRDRPEAFTSYVVGEIRELMESS